MLVFSHHRLLDLIDSYRHVWLTRSLPAGLPDSLLLLSAMLKQFVPEGPPSMVDNGE